MQSTLYTTDFNNDMCRVIQRSWRKKKNYSPPTTAKRTEHDINDTVKKANEIVNRLVELGTGAAPAIPDREGMYKCRSDVCY